LGLVLLIDINGRMGQKQFDNFVKAVVGGKVKGSPAIMVAFVDVQGGLVNREMTSSRWPKKEAVLSSCSIRKVK